MKAVLARRSRIRGTPQIRGHGASRHAGQRSGQAQDSGGPGPRPSQARVRLRSRVIVVAGQRRELVEAARWLDAGDRRLLALWWQEASGELADALRVQPKHAAVRVQRMKAQLDVARGVVRALRARPR
ncbi:hypothetical protein [Actinoplanes subtropicus]|uniref:hypothetical protein n=1 Tax=Actinoplanes subtropicus TaxID=543632 RepID=UPI0014708476|nr:hypothetical protein [Actinoplanes subtropicus]